MKLISLLLFITTSITIADTVENHRPHYEKCQFKALLRKTFSVPKLGTLSTESEKDSTFTKLIQIKIKEASPIGNSMVDCTKYIGQSKLMTTTVEDLGSVAVGEMLDFEYEVEFSKGDDGPTLQVLWDKKS